MVLEVLNTLAYPKAQNTLAWPEPDTLAFSAEICFRCFGACSLQPSLLERPTFDAPWLQMLECDVAEGMLKS